MAEYQLKINTSEIQEAALQDLLNRLTAEGRSVTASEYFESILLGSLAGLVEQYRRDDVKKVSEALRNATDAEVSQVKQILQVI